jgi:hypothetical protein
MSKRIHSGDHCEKEPNSTDVRASSDEIGNVNASVPSVLMPEEAVIVAEAKHRLASDQPRRTSDEVRVRIRI